MGVGGHHVPAALPPGKGSRYPLYMRLSGAVWTGAESMQLVTGGGSAGTRSWSKPYLRRAHSSATHSQTHIWPCWCALMSVVRMKQVLSHAGDNLTAQLVILLSLFIFIKTTGRDRCWKGSPELGHLHEERMYYFKVSWSGFRRSFESTNDWI